MYEFPKAAIMKYHRLGGLNNSNLFFSPFWRVEVWNEGITRAIFLWRHQGRMYSLLPSGSFRHSLAYGCLIPKLCLHVVLSLCASVFIWPSSYKDTNHSGLGTHPTPTWPLNYICNTISKSSHIKEFGLQHISVEELGDIVQPMTS